MLKQSLRFLPQPWADVLLKAGLGCILLCFAGPMSIPLDDGLSVTLQTLFVLLPAILFGWETGMLCVGLYIAIGAAGVPVFPNDKAGTEHLMSPVGGFYFGFLFAAGITGYLAERLKFSFLLNQVVLWLGGHMIILTAGFFWLWSTSWKPQNLDPWVKLKTNLTDLSPGLVIKCALGMLLVQVVKRMVERRIRSV